MTDQTDVLIVGGGPAGLTAAIYTARAALTVVVLEGEPSSTSDQPGGQLMLTTDVENYPGFPNGVTGPQLITDLREQATKFGARLVPGKAARVKLDRSPFHVEVSGDAGAFSARSVIVATGSRTRMLGLPREQDLIGRGVSTCATCDGFFFRGHDIAVVGGGDSALEEALFLSRFARSVTIIHRRDELRASKILQARAEREPKITVRWNSVLDEFVGNDRLEGVRLRDTTTGSHDVLPVTGLFLAIGHLPNTAVFDGQLELDDLGYLVTRRGSATTVPGVFACGDVQDPVYRQAITSAGSGCMAALDAERWLEELAHDLVPASELAEPAASTSGSV
ncbi:thioredoxin-disulfide reductase [Amycolatopsis sp. DSM 110486]|uniref:thioredoxin-disulfide reductase n=1 Tax=Amycolatopsis sp. DSM 110486 TaxID=2865832 RepID=UPI001C69EF51|nr:thioredoxin-disulfide reductase [Amycolatopsis sp. DSM 110486]QYN21170.1 thioredoxin-disulfide reductase [Amycolatopsis sp. DSM 110486]